MSENRIFACHITGIFDVNRGATLTSDNFAWVEKWATAIEKLKLKGVLFHNNFSDATINRYKSEYLEFVFVNYDPKYKPNVFRYLAYREYLKQVRHLDGLFLTDVNDVEVVINPFLSDYFSAFPNSIFCGDEPTLLQNDWMQSHSGHLRSKISDYAAYEAQFKDEILLNCGIVGGAYSSMKPFIDQLAAIHENYNFDNTTEFTGDMGAFNYLLRTQYENRVQHGPPINTRFKSYETDRSDCWFRHK